jgi:SHS2 domain-containing protein
MKDKPYELIEHTADVGIRVKADALKGLFEKAAQAMFQIIAEKKNPPADPPQRLIVKQDAQDVKELFVEWLNELLSLSSAKNLIFSEFKIGALDENHLEAEVFGSPAQDFRVNAEIKAATYHQLKLEKAASGWVVEVIFDV